MEHNDVMYRIHSNMLQMMRDRGYIVPPEFDKDVLTKELFVQKYAGESDEVEREQLKIRFVHQTERYKVLVLFEKNSKVGKSEIQRICERLGDDTKRCVVILNGALSAPARLQVETMAPEVILEFFREEQLLVNITEHRLVPLHQPLTQAQKETVLARYKVKETQLPRMELADPIARYFGLQRGDVVKITRSSETAGRYVTYRLVV